MSPKFIEKVLAVVVLYEKDPAQSESLTSLKDLASKGLKVLIFDNSKSPSQPKESFFTYHHSATNVGVSGAYNHAAQIAEYQRKSWLWVLDDDSTVNMEFLEEAAMAIKRQPDLSLIVPRVYSNGKILSPFRFQKSRPERTADLQPGMKDLTELRPINSGMLLSLHAFKKAGGYSTEFPLDFSDIEFTDRLLEHTQQFYVTRASLFHSFSGDEKKDQQQDLDRFRMFLKAAARYYSIAEVPAAVKGQALRRAMRLSFAHFSLSFLLLYLKTPFHP